MNKNQLKLIQTTSKSRFLPHFILAPIIALVCLIVGQIIGVSIFEALCSNLVDASISMSSYLILTTGFPILVLFLWVRFAEKRAFSSIGFYKSFFFIHYIKGFFIGFLLFTVVIIFLLVFGFAKLSQDSLYSLGISAIPSISIMLIAWLIQGASEEIITRGWLMNVLIARYNIPFGIIFSSTLFGVLHILNDSVSYLAILNIILIGLFFGLYALKTENLWGACGAHSAWNWVQGNVFGLNVSGNTVYSSLTQIKVTGPELITGGSFGPEGGLVVSIVIIISLILLYRVPWKESKLE